MTAFLIIDVETSGLDREQDELLEVGAAVFDADHGVPVECWSSIVAAGGNPIQQLNRIPPAVVQDDRRLLSHAAIDRLRSMVEGCRPDDVYLLAHNAAFDRQWLPELEGRRGMGLPPQHESARRPEGNPEPLVHGPLRLGARGRRRPPLPGAL
ncbi:MAG: hypothetical protein ACODAG_12190 [Myxococcota bacterium]